MPRDYLLDDYSFSFEPVSQITEFSTKNTRQRALYRKRDTIFNVSERLSLSEFASFEYWVNITLNGGADSFQGNYWDGDYERSGTVSIVDGKYSFKYESAQSVVVSYQLELKDRSIADGEAIYNLWQGGVPMTQEYFNAFEQAINFNHFSL